MPYLKVQSCKYLGALLERLRKTMKSQHPGQSITVTPNAICILLVSISYNLSFLEGHSEYIQ
jgi:hypothetical protein